MREILNKLNGIQAAMQQVKTSGQDTVTMAGCLLQMNDAIAMVVSKIRAEEEKVPQESDGN